MKKIFLACTARKLSPTSLTCLRQFCGEGVGGMFSFFFCGVACLLKVDADCTLNPETFPLQQPRFQDASSRNPGNRTAGGLGWGGMGPHLMGFPSHISQTFPCSPCAGQESYRASPPPAPQLSQFLICIPRHLPKETDPSFPSTLLNGFFKFATFHRRIRPSVFSTVAHSFCVTLTYTAGGCEAAC